MGNLIIQGLDPLDVAGFVSKKNKKYQAILLQDIEEILGKDSEEYKQIRGLILDSYNDYTRSILRVVFGNTFDL
jgi:hypothetical protein